MFCLWSGPFGFFSLCSSIIINYVFAFFILRFKAAKIFLIFAVCANLSFLAVLKFTGLQLGISFYALCAVSYLVEIYNEKNTSEKNNILSLSLYFSMFFKFVAGPIAKYKDIKSQIQKKNYNAEIFANGIHCFVCGLCKKLIFANTLKEFFVYTKALPIGDITTLGAWLGIFAFGLSIYYELSGYFDMALGLGKMFGFDLPKNFDYPYKAKSITEFWQSWNI